MNCKNFEAIITDLAREQILEATTRAQALKHVEECSACAARLEAERLLTAGLRALAASVESVEAPARVEAELLMKFRECRAKEISPAEVSPAVVVPMTARVSRWQRWYPQAAAAAVLLMFAIGGAVALRNRQTNAPAAGPAVARSVKEENRAVTSATGKTTPVAAQPSQDENDPPEEIAAVTGSSNGGQRLSRREADIILGKPARSSNVVNVPRSRVKQSALAQTTDEIVTDFIPVAYGDNLNAIDSGRIVRVEVPRSALAQFGLPVNMDRANERVKADVLIGEDGMARAIRFVR